MAPYILVAKGFKGGISYGKDGKLNYKWTGGKNGLKVAAHYNGNGVDTYYESLLLLLETSRPGTFKDYTNQ